MRISTGRNRKDQHWKVEEYSWVELCDRLSHPIRTGETVQEYRRMTVADRAERKDQGGFVGGVLKGGRRLKSNMMSRTLITLDADFVTARAWENVKLMCDHALCCYSTHSHRPDQPRLRYVLPLDRPVTPEEYEPIARRIASELDIAQFDVTTYETSRLFYWPSLPTDGEFVYEVLDGEPVCADEVLASYKDWHDTREWPLGPTEQTVRIAAARKQGDPTAKRGVVGDFCRTYDVPAAIETFLSDVYEPCADSDRYTYLAGSTAAGVVIYENGAFAYSHHSTDPAGGKLCNAFDLVRLHKFGEMDRDVDPQANVPVTQLPSYKAMCEFVCSDGCCRELYVRNAKAAAEKAFGTAVGEAEGAGESDLDWMDTLDFNKKGSPEATVNNLVKILENDSALSGKLRFNEFKGLPVITGDMPWRRCHDRANGDVWRDEDMAELVVRLEKVYKLYNAPKLDTAFSAVVSRRSFHPVRDYLNGLVWDGVPRGERLFIEYLGAEDNLYTRTVTRKWLTAAVARVMEPGCKFDNLVVLVGAQGIGKSYLGHLLGRNWFSDTLTTMQGKDAYEQLNGSWIIEIAELSAMKKAEVEGVKMFISKQEDNYRGAYRRFVSSNKRQCVFYGTTNDDTFLRDGTGNRRFWPIGTDKERATENVFDLTWEDIDQIWAEAVNWYAADETLYLDATVSSLAAEEQEKYRLLDPRQGMIEEYLDKLLPEDWESYTKQKRREYIQGFNFSEDVGGTVLRETVSVPEMAYELFGEEVLQPWQAKEYHGILTGLRGWRKRPKRTRSFYGTQFCYERIGEQG